MRIADVLNRIFRPAALNEEKAAQAIVAHPDKAAAGFDGLLTHINNKCHPLGVGCQGQKGYLAQVKIGSFARSKGATAPDVAEAKLLLVSLKCLERDLRNQLRPAQRNAGEHPSWNNDRLHELNKALDLARNLQRFRGPD